MGLVQEVTDRFVVFAHLLTAWKASKLSECPSLSCGTCPDVAIERVPPALEKGLETLRIGYEECLGRARDCQSSNGVIILFWLGVLCGVILTVFVWAGLFLLSRFKPRSPTSSARSNEYKEELIARPPGPATPATLRR